MARARDYAAEYRRRIASGLTQGRTRSEARGHPRVGERGASPKAAEQRPDRKLIEGVRALRETRSLTEAAREVKTSPERLRRFVRGLDFVEKRGGRYAVGDDPWLRSVPLYSAGRRITVTVKGYEEARKAGEYWEAVGAFLRTNELRHLSPFVGVSVTAANGTTYPLETRPNVLYRLARQGGESFEQIYQIII